MGILGFLGFANVYAMRVNLSVAIVAMVNNTGSSQIISNNTFDHCPVPNITNSTTPDVIYKRIYRSRITFRFFFRRMVNLIGTKRPKQ